MEINFEYLIGDDVVVKSSNDLCRVEQRRCTINDSGTSTYIKEEYYVKYINKPYSQGIWVMRDNVTHAKVEDELENEYQVLSVLIDTYLLKEHRNLELVKMYVEMRDNLDSNK